MKKRVALAEFRSLVRRLVSEQLDQYVSDDGYNADKEAHAEPSGRNWDTGLDEGDAAQQCRKYLGRNGEGMPVVCTRPKGHKGDHDHPSE
jgi:hypothetical protein